MKLLAPAYYKNFKCAADRCTHSCCVGWEIDVDSGTLAAYQRLSHPIGGDIRASIAAGEDGAHFCLNPDGKCPHLDERGLCRIILALGEEALPEICREHPRFYNRVNGRLECGIGVSCEVAAELVLFSDSYATLVEIGEDPCVGEPPADLDVVAARERVFAILSDRSLPYARREALIEAECRISATLSHEEREALLSELEYLDPAHESVLAAAFSAPVCRDMGESERLFERLLAYFIYRHASAAKTRRDFDVLVGVALLLVRLFAAILSQSELTPVSAAVLLSEELEYSEDNLEVIRFAVEMHNI